MFITSWIHLQMNFPEEFEHLWEEKTDISTET